MSAKIPILPWCESPLQPETNMISNTIAYINRSGFLTINSQPAVNGEKSNHPTFGWGGEGGRVYQKAYIEFFTSPKNLKLVVDLVEKNINLVFYAVDCDGVLKSSNYSDDDIDKTNSSNSSGNGISNADNNNNDSNNTLSNIDLKSVAALTWGVFSNREILQPTIFDPNTFLGKSFKLLCDA